MAQPTVQGIVLESSTANTGTVLGSSSVTTDATKADIETGTLSNPAISVIPLEVRNGFVKKVYMLLTLMLVISTCVATLFQLVLAEKVQENTTVIKVLMFGSFIITLMMACCCMQMMKSYPANYIFLFIFSLLYGVIIGAVTLHYTLPSVLLAAGITAAMFFMLTAYACFTKTDFTGLGPYLFCVLFGLIAFGLALTLVSLFCSSCYPLMHVIYAVIGAILFSMYIIYDTQKIVGGAHKKFQFSVDDYAFAALNLYLDIINLFLMILSLFGQRN